MVCRRKCCRGGVRDHRLTTRLATTTDHWPGPFSRHLLCICSAVWRRHLLNSHQKTAAFYIFLSTIVSRDCNQLKIKSYLTNISLKHAIYGTFLFSKKKKKKGRTTTRVFCCIPMWNSIYWYIFLFGLIENIYELTTAIALCVCMVKS